ncbi:MAG: triose-phosphate isomerase [Hyphomicrobiaceae bacterium]
MTTPKIRPLVAGNWKMNGLKASVAEALAMREGANEASVQGADVLICPPATLLMALSEIVSDSRVLVGGQDCHTATAGAHTGDLSAEMLADAGASFVVVGHSERRGDHGESDENVKSKTEAAHRAGLIAIVCIGETAGQREAGLTLDVVNCQLQSSLPDQVTAANTVIAYEPVWAIGTGLTPTPDDVGEVHAALRQSLVVRYGDEGAAMRLLYGGSVKPANASELMGIDNVNGALIGGASLKAKDFLGILAAYAT